MADLRDFLQSMSNSAASNVSAPVDGINWLMRKSGLPVSDAPFMGSDWMAQKGFTKPVKQGAASVLGETAGMLAPMAIAAKAPQIARGLLQAEANAMAPRTLNPQTGAIVWHGSPHKFDKFDSSKIGTGDGAQAYGHGIYTAESPEVAMKYQPRDPRLESKIMQRYSAAERQQNYPAMQVFEDFGLNRTPEEVLSSINEAGYSAKDLKAALDAHKIASKEYASQSAGSLYKVDLPDEHIARMLDWDKPLSQQHPDVQAAMQSLHGKDALGRPLERPRPLLMDSNGQWAYQNIQDGRNQRLASEALAKAGIPGIRYLDGGSRGAGQGSSNFVVFPGNEGLLSILERNGQQI